MTFTEIDRLIFMIKLNQYINTFELFSVRFKKILKTSVRNTNEHSKQPKSQVIFKKNWQINVKYFNSKYFSFLQWNKNK